MVEDWDGQSTPPIRGDQDGAFGDQAIPNGQCHREAFMSGKIGGKPNHRGGSASYPQ